MRRSSSLRRGPACAHLLLVLGLIVGAACEAANAQASPEVAPEPSPAQPAAHAPPPLGPPSDLERIPADQRRIVGVVQEVLPAGGYHYLALRLDDGSTRWAVIANGAPSTGERVELDGFGVRTNYHSNRLERDFEALLFAALVK